MYYITREMDPIVKISHDLVMCRFLPLIRKVKPNLKSQANLINRKNLYRTGSCEMFTRAFITNMTSHVIMLTNNFPKIFNNAVSNVGQKMKKTMQTIDLAMDF